MDFFEMCEVETSLFDKEYARQNSDWQLIREAYNYNLDKAWDCCPESGDPEHSIPKIIHFIWMGTLPEKYIENIDDWKKKNPEHEVWVWDDKKIAEFVPTMTNRDLFEVAPRLGGKSDILRYEILKKYGGLYVDTDFLCNADFKYLHEKHSFYAGICLERPVQLNNGIMASAPDHPILDICINEMTLDNPWNIQCPETLVLYQTGPWALTRSVLHYMHNFGYDGVIIFPSQTFHPFPAAKRHNPTEELIKSYYKPWTMACHLWHSSWQPNSEHYHGK